MMRVAAAAAGLGLLLVFAGCSVVLALDPNKGPDLSAFGVGSTREEVEQELGRPIESWINADGGRTAVYTYKTRDTDLSGLASNKLRSLQYAADDLASFGLSEVTTTPMETIIRATQTARHRMIIDDDSDNRVVAINRQVRVLPPETNKEEESHNAESSE